MQLNLKQYIAGWMLLIKTSAAKEKAIITLKASIDVRDSFLVQRDLEK